VGHSLTQVLGVASRRRHEERSKSVVPALLQHGRLDAGALMVVYIDLLVALLINVYYFVRFIRTGHLPLLIFAFIVQISDLAIWYSLYPTFKLTSWRSIGLIAIVSLYVRDIGSDKDPVVIAKTDYSYDLPALIRIGLLLHVYDFYWVIFHLLCSWRH
jgi:hypothetical protein